VPISIDRPAETTHHIALSSLDAEAIYWDDDVLGRSDLFVIWMTLGRASRLMTPA
jgi:hypothetical protein